MRKIFYILGSIVLVVLSGCIIRNKAHQHNDLSMDFFGDGVYVNEVLCIEDEISFGTIAKPGKSKEQIQDFIGFILPKGILYIVVDTRELEGGYTQERIEEINLFKKEWAEGEYERYERFVYPFWMVYGDNEHEKLMIELNGYYEGAGWYIYVPGDANKQFFAPVSSLEEVNIFDFLDPHGN